MFSRNTIMLDAVAPAAAPVTSAPAGMPEVTGTPSSGGQADSGLAQAAADGTIKPVASVPGEVQMVEYKEYGKLVRIPMQEAIRRLSLVGGAQASFKEAAEMTKTARDRERLFGESPYKYYRSIGKTHQEARDIIEGHAVEVMREDNLTPDQRELKAEREARAQLQSEKEVRERAELTQREQVQLDQQLADWDSKMTQALASSILPPDPLFKGWATDIIRASVSSGLEVSPADAMKEVEFRYLDQVKRIVGQWDAKIVKQVFGSELISKLRTDDVSDIRKAEAPLGKPAQAPRQVQPPTKRPVASETSAPPQRESRAELFDRLRGHNFKRK